MVARAFLLAILFAACPRAAGAQAAKFEMVKVAEGVYAALRTNHLESPVDGNSVVVVNDEDVLVVDTNLTPASARAVLAEIRKLTPKPVRYVVNTHHHSDHIYGNQVYREAFPGVEIIAHAHMREEFERSVPSGFKEFMESSRRALAEGPGRLKSGLREDGRLMTGEERAALARRLDMLRANMPALEEIRPTAPTVTVGDGLTLHRGGREIRILHLGRGNTRGDLVVYLPREKVVAAGDLVVYPVPFALESRLGPWVETMKRLRAVDADVLIPGHGPLMRDREYLDYITGMFEFVLARARDAAGRGMSLEEARSFIDLEPYRLRLAGDDAARNRAFKAYFATPAVESAYREAKGEPPPP